jgi:hypothetical protein
MARSGGRFRGRLLEDNQHFPSRLGLGREASLNIAAIAEGRVAWIGKGCGSQGACRSRNPSSRSSCQFWQRFGMALAHSVERKRTVGNVRTWRPQVEGSCPRLSAHFGDPFSCLLCQSATPRFSSKGRKGNRGGHHKHDGRNGRRQVPSLWLSAKLAPLLSMPRSFRRRAQTSGPRRRRPKPLEVAQERRQSLPPWRWRHGRVDSRQGRHPHALKRRRKIVEDVVDLVSSWSSVMLRRTSR